MLYDDKLKHNTIINEIKLGGNNDFILYETFIEKDKTPSLQDLYVKYKGRTVVEDYHASIEFFYTLDSFLKKSLTVGDENRFFKYVEKKEHNIIKKSLQCIFDRTRYISMLDARIMKQYYFESKIGCSIRSILTSKEVFSLHKIFNDENITLLFSSEDMLINIIENKLEEYGIKYKKDSLVSKKIDLLLEYEKYHKNSANEMDD